MAVYNFTNLAPPTELNGGITSGASSLVVDDATGYPAVPFKIRINAEVITVAAKSGTTFSSLGRGDDGTTGAAHSDTDQVEHVVTAEDIMPRWDASTQNYVMAADLEMNGTTMQGPLDPTAGDQVADRDYNDARYVGAAGSFIRCARITSAQVITNNTATTIILNSIIREDDPSGRLSMNTSTGVLTINESGWYQVSGGILWEGQATPVGRRLLTLKASTFGDIAAQEEGALTSLTAWGRQTASGLAYITATETIVVEGYHTQGGDEDALVSGLTHMAVAWLGT